MRKYILVLAWALASATVWAQQGFQYNATVTNADGTLATGKEVSVKFSILDMAENVVYSEVHDASTDASGRLSLVIGAGESLSGSFGLVKWSNGGLSLQTEIDRGEGYTLSGRQPFGSVPYAMAATTAAGMVQQSASGDFWKMTVGNDGRLSAEKVVSEIIPIPEGYSQLVFNDEFNGEGFPDESKWTFEKGYVRNGEMQYYAEKRKENCWIENGCLNITARNDNYELDGETHEVTSASIHTRDKAKWTYCRVDVRAKLPVCLGSWPAIWLMPNDDFYGMWPRSGEIDIMENVGYDPNKVHFTAHCAEQNGANNDYHRQIYLPSSYTQFHVYSLIWTKDKLSWLVDNKVKFTVKRTSTTWRGWPYNKDFYLILNLAFGGGWGGQQGVDLTQLPVTYEVDYVRIFQ